MDVEEVKEELTKRMVEAYSDYMEGPADGEYADGYASGCEYAIELLENLQEKKVVIPKFVANWIEEANEHKVNPMEIVCLIDKKVRSRVSDFDWLKYEKHQQLLLSAIASGYEVEKPRRVVKLKGIHGLRKYVRLDDEGKVILGLAGSDGITGGALTVEEAKEKWPEFEIYYNAGLLEFEEVEND
ncbi:DUF1642 domain-containing protein [Pediococcus acidilactici]|uniref:DUF1642 domain-containing protein n=1 Tax=Pediococcus acidilactici TaxID=1254 RepID=UPI000326DAC1|nr:DUF1642 domain-containing protein [Pediococcus acidilactici]EOA09481.1 hypothetical protein PAD3_0574 [Pediococcus acidilactici D3]MBW4796956.1 DUF1642 domain-containing protein [Pediococcus acidilactici]MBW9306210.1 DUF1642 domain-containing protein [Pediococcus acidilactici]MCE5961369.1 DUF1642 domain-containing protein [Pediococcus acidilactici]MCW8082300.1 DUF1642 domain-containing protein [Pediococcus acidilactici]